MATFTDNINSQYRAELIVAIVSQDIANNRSKVRRTLRVRKLSGSGYFTNTGQAWSMSGGGSESGTWTYDFSDYTVKEIYEDEVWINHDADGTKSYTASASVSMAPTPGGTGTPSGTVTLTTIPRATEPEVSGSVSLSASGGSLTISTPRASSSFTHELLYSFGSIKNEPLAYPVTTSYTWAVPASLLNQMTDVTTLVGTITCRTYSGSTLVGTKTVNFRINVASSVVPVISAITDSEATAGLAANVGAYVQGLTKLNLGMTGSAGVYGSSITSRELKVIKSGTTLATINATSGTTGVITESGTVTLQAKVTDSRGRSTTITRNITFLAWAPPVLNTITARRSLLSGTLDTNGTYIRVDLNAAVSSLVNGTERNALNYRISTRVKGTTTWTEQTNQTPGGITFNSNRVIGSSPSNLFSITSSYEVLVEVYDDFITSAKILTVATSSIFMHWGDANAGEGVGIGKYWEHGALDVNGDIYLSGRLIGPHIGYGEAAGSLSIVPSAANTPTSASVLFPAGRFTVTPLAIAGTSNPIARAGTSAVTTDGCTLTIIRENTSSTVVTWQAKQMTSVSAAG